jgi:hypothetical protein
MANELDYQPPENQPPPAAPAEEDHAEDSAVERGTVSSLDLRKAPRPPWTGWDVLLIAITAALSSFAALAAVFVMRDRGRSLQALASSAWILVPAQMAGYVITFLLMYVLVTRVYRLPFWRGIQWIWPRNPVSAISFALVGVMLAVGLGLLQRLLPMPQHVPFDRLFTTAAAIHLMAVFGILVAPFMEELFFRGFLYPVLTRWGKGMAILATAMAFAVVHGGQYAWAWSAVLLMFIVGLTLTIARASTGSIAPGFLIHASYNATLFMVMYFATDHLRHLERL